MPISQTLITELKSHRPLPKMLNLSECELTDKDIETLVQVLNNHPYVRHLDVSDNSITDEGLKLLATCPTLNLICVMSNPISERGLILLSQSPNLNELIYTYTAIDNEENYEIIGKNRLAHDVTIRQQRQNFMRALIQLGRARNQGASLVSHLPVELLLHIISYFDFASMGKTQQQGVEFAKFIFTHLSLINEYLKLNQKIVIAEKVNSQQPHSFFYFKTNNSHLDPALNKALSFEKPTSPCAKKIKPSFPLIN